MNTPRVDNHAEYKDILSQIKELQQKAKEKFKIVAVEYTANMDPRVIAEKKQALENEKITLEKNKSILKMNFRKSMQDIRAELNLNNEKMGLLGFTVKNTLKSSTPVHKYWPENGKVHITRVDNKELATPYCHDINENWQKDTRHFLDSIGSDSKNIVHKLSKLVECYIATKEIEKTEKSI